MSTETLHYNIPTVHTPFRLTLKNQKRNDYLSVVFADVCGLNRLDHCLDGKLARITK